MVLFLVCGLSGTIRAMFAFVAGGVIFLVCE
jgi:hypothetical protein